jgi:lipoprotein-anchoring transpeptidase ErfK/SrfK
LTINASFPLSIGNEKAQALFPRRDGRDQKAAWEWVMTQGLKRWLAAAVLLAPVALAGLSAMDRAEAREIVRVGSQMPAGTIVIRNSERRLYLVQSNGLAIRYRIAVGRPSEQWLGETVISGRHVRPAWSPPAVVRRANPQLPDLIPGGAPNNPMGAAALTLAGGEYAIHGTSDSMRRSVGTAASFGCFRMYNEDVLDLLERVSVGTRVVVTR